MPEMSSIPPRSQDRILREALALFSSRGYDATSVREICAAAEITKPTLYHFYGSKEGVYRALVDDTLEDFKRALVAAVAQSGTAEERLRHVARTYFERTRSHLDLMRLIMGLVHNPATAAPRTDFVRFYDEVVNALVACVEEGVARGEFVPGRSDVRMLIFMGALGEALCGSLVCGRPELTLDLADALVDGVVGGWRARP